MVPGIETMTVTEPPAVVLLALLHGSTCCRPKRKRTSVAFAPSLEIHVVEPFQESTWYSGDDYAVFEDDVRRTIRTMRQDSLHDSRICVRGLEKYGSLERHEEKKLREKSHVFAILKEQARQRRKGVRNPRQFRTLSRTNSKWSRDVAIQQGKRDAQYVGIIHVVKDDDNDDTLEEEECESEKEQVTTRGALVVA